MKKRWLAGFLCIPLFLMMVTGCARAQISSVVFGAAAADWPVKVANVILAKEPAGVAVLSGNIADILLKLRYETVLKARSEDCSQNELSSLPVYSLDQAKELKNLGVDLALTDQTPTQDQTKAFSDAGIILLSLSPANGRADLCRLYTEVGTAVKGERTGYEQGARMAEQVLMGIDSVARIIPDKNVLLTGIYVSDLGGSTVTGDMFQNSILESAGITNVAADFKGGKMDLTALKRENPQVIFCPIGLKEKLESADIFEDLSAVKEGRVYEIDPNYMKWQGETVIFAVTEIAGFAYPELKQTGSLSAL
ncbi:ABC transporter substrate-binding protein [Caproicibacterium sp. BJN0003]|uniref:ABC transporter substrate-binding protein n=1 Tax=Caproicibacterium sp. BJN0003 TaxID=2994078 RepID=UPI002258EA99|nr:ABC transporter substrate-binding protein [Caproicibacterium sp. BJN0003]UZT82602.1 ABC transporter substrate-binding protein [Caproicibacterium sp. BJN0003]